MVGRERQSGCDLPLGVGGAEVGGRVRTDGAGRRGEELAGDWHVQWKQEGACLCCAPAL